MITIEQTEAIVREEVEELFAQWEDRPPSNDLFLQRLAPELAQASGVTRSFTSKLGNRLAHIARRMAEKRYGEAACPPILRSRLLDSASHVAEPNSSTAGRGDTRIFSDFPEAQVRAAADQLTLLARQHSIGQEEWRRRLEGELEELADSERVDPWSCEIDLAVITPELGLAEMKTGGNLDSTKAPAETKKVVLAGLMYADPDLPLRFVCAYANRGEGVRIQGALPTYFVDSGPDPTLLAGELFWDRLLPEEMSFEDFLRIFESLGEQGLFSN